MLAGRTRDDYVQVNRSKPRAAKHRGSVRYFHPSRPRWLQHRSKFHRGRQSGRPGGVQGDISNDRHLHVCKQEFQNRMSRAKGGFTVELKRPKRHLLNRSAIPKASWITESALQGTEPRDDLGTRAGASSDHDTRAMAERLFAPRTAGQALILPVLSPMAAVSQTADAPRGPVEHWLPEEKEVTSAIAVSVQTDDASVTDAPASEVTEDTVTLSGTLQPGKPQKTRRVPASDLPAGKRWMRLLPSVLQERAIPRWRRMRSARVASQARQRPDQTFDESQ